MQGEPREKKWLFDKSLFYSGDYENIQSEIERNRKEAVRSFANKIRPEEKQELTESWNQCIREIQYKIEDALKELE